LSSRWRGSAEVGQVSACGGGRRGDPTDHHSFDLRKHWH
jgi:hypothetical protein